MQHLNSPKKVFIKPVIHPKSVAIPRDQRVAGLMDIPHVDGWMSLKEILQIYKLPNERN
jgi:hypothetical protein